ncbi:MAG: ATP-binding protein [Myxacorys californica WJT36-NPBG1]|jgi:hypothetical protein|nr:ATP-binding protein [Myxacorys californica WJT36-NPBG1]
MSSFSIERQHKAPIEWKETAWKSVDKDSYMIDTAIALFAGLGVSAIASPIAGGAIAAFMIKRIFDKENQKIKAQDCIREYGLVAPFLNGDEFLNFASQAGSDAVIAELQFAHERGLNLSDAAWDYLDGYNELMALPQAEREGWAVMPALPDEPAKAIGEPTRLGAVAVQASPVEKCTTAFEALLASPFTSRAIFGAQRTGKSYLAACASLELAKRGISVFHINLMSYGDEDSQYWQHAKRSVRCDLPSLSVRDGVPFIKQAMEVLKAFIDTPNSLLIVDEWAYIGATATPHRDSLEPLLNALASQIASLSSAGIKRQRGLWVIAPEFVAGGLVPNGKTAKKLQLVYATIHPDRTLDWNGNHIGFSGELFDQVKNNFPIDLPASLMELPNCDRIVYINREWMPVGELPSLPKWVEAQPTVPTDPRAQLEKAWVSFDDSGHEAIAPAVETDPAIELIQNEPNEEKREALMIGYQWAKGRITDGKEVSREAFLNRAKNERKCEHLREKRNEIWNELEALIS